MAFDAYDCECCGDTFPSLRAAMMCEERDLEDAKQARRRGRAPRVMRPAARWDDD